LVLGAEYADAALVALEHAGQLASVVGEVTAGADGIRFR
jgi:hypothetical protein